MRRRALWMYVFGAWTLYGLVHGAVWCAASSNPAEAVAWAFPAALAIAWTWALLTPGVFVLATRLTPSRYGWFLSLTGHAVAMLVCAALVSMVRRESLSLFGDSTSVPFVLAFVWWLDVWLFVYLTLVVIARALELRRRYVDRTLRADVLEAQLARSQLQFLESQLQPHFLFNALNTIQELAHEAPRAASEMLQRLRRLLALSLERHGQDEVELREELAVLEPYLDIQRARFSNWLTVVIDVPDEVSQARVPHLVLQPLVENAIRHGLAVRSAPGTLVIRARRDGEWLHLDVEDNGVGLRDDPMEARGIGIRNLIDRLVRLYGPGDHFSIMERQEGGVRARLRLPWRAADSVRVPTPVPTPGVESLWRTGEFTSSSSLDTVEEVAATASAERASVFPALPVRVWLGIAGVWLLLAVFWTNQVVLFMNLRMSDQTPDVWGLARLQMGTSAIWLAMSIPVLWLARRFRFTPENWPRRLPIHISAGIAAAFVHLAVARAVGLSEIPILNYNNLNPITGDFFIYLGMLAWSHSRDFVAWFRERDMEAGKLTARISKARFQALRIRLRPEFVLATLERLERMVYEDAERAERLIARLADTLRLTLEVGRQPTTSVQRELELVRAGIEAHRLGVRPGVRVAIHADPGVEQERIPSRLVCATVDELLANAWVEPNDPLHVDVEVAQVAGSLRVTIRASAEGLVRAGAAHAWWHREGIAERAVEYAGAQVSVLVPDATSVVLMLGDDDAAGVLSEERLASESAA